MTTLPERRTNRGIIVYPDFVLTHPSQPIVEFDEALRWFATRLEQAQRIHRARGVAACQIGVPGRVFLFMDGYDCHVIVNPEIVSLEGTQISFEGCPSLPGARTQVRRAMTVTVKGKTLKGDDWEFSTENPVTASAIQHEYDHLDGRLILDHCNRQRRRDVLRRVKVPA